jgi:hypothetical protein
MLARMEDSSVLFNLNEIMRLERDRVVAEAAAARAAEAHAIAERDARARRERERVERERALAEAAVQEREQRAREAERQHEAERAAALLQIQLEADAKRRMTEQQLELVHASRMAELAETQRKKRASWLIAGSLVALAVGSGAAYSLVLEPALRSAKDQSAALDRLAADAAAQTAALARQMDELRNSRAQPALSPSAPEQSRTEAKAPSRERARPSKPLVKKPPVQAKRDALGSLDCSNSDDPLCGLDSAPDRKRR